MNLKEELKGCWVVITTIIGLLVVGIIVLAVMGTLGDLTFDLLHQKK